MGSKKNYEEHKAAGICVTCGTKKAVEGRVMCRECAEKSRIRTAERRKWLKEKHYCTDCGCEKVYGEEKLCPECAAKKYASNRKSRAGKPYNRKIHLIWYESRKEKGICTRCGRKAEAGKTMCGIGNAKHRREAFEYRGGESRSERPGRGYCYICGERLTDTRRLCDRCSTRAAKNLPEGGGDNREWRRLNSLVFSEKRG